MRLLPAAFVMAAVLAAPVLTGAPAAAAADVPLCDSVEATIIGTEGPDVLVGTSDDDVIVGLGGDDHITSDGALVCGGEGGDTLLSPTGGRLLGGPGDDWIEVTAGDESTGGVLRGEEGDDTLLAGVSGADLHGGEGNDTLTGGPARNYLVPGPGRDTVDGGTDESLPDTLSYVDSAWPVVVNLAKGIARGEGRDTLVNVDGVDGSRFDDRLIGDDGPNTLNSQIDGVDFVSGRGGDDLLYGRATILGGAGDDHLWQDTRTDGVVISDRLDGGPGYDQLSYGFEGGPVTLDLVTDSSTGPLVGDDAALRIEAGRGTYADDTFRGDDADNYFYGDKGADRLLGLGGNDTLDGTKDDDLLLGGPGTDSLDGGSGTDRCRSGESTTGCES